MSRASCTWLALALMAAPVAVADPLLRAGDVRLRDDVQRLADAGIIRSPVMTWPISWPQIGSEVAAVDPSRYDAAVQAIIARVHRQATKAARTGGVSWSARAAAAEKPTQLRTFEATPRDEGELEIDAAYTGQRFAWRAAATVVADPADGKTLRPDGSYVGVLLGNWMLTAGFLDRWWGPGWEGSLILSSNARPIPSLSIERNFADPFATPLLSWIGPWRLSFQLGQLEGDRNDFAHPAFFGLRIDFRPLESLEIGISRTAQFCGEGRPCGFNQFWDLLWGRDNNQPLEEQPGNQLAGFDARWTVPGDWLPIALYGQMIGEDEAGFLPSKYLGLFGVEVWGSIGSGSWRAHVEYADTACEFSRSEPAFNCAYTSAIYTDGYTYRGRSIGHAMGGDGRMLSGAASYVDAGGALWTVLLRSVELNRAGVSRNHPLTPVPVDLTNVEISTTQEYQFGTIRVGLGYDRVDATADVPGNDDFRGFLEWQRDF